MDSETNTDTHSSFESLLFSKDGSLKSPESSDCEGYATPLASSLENIAFPTNHGITINLPEQTNEQRAISSGELTPVSTTRAASPPVVRQVIHLEKSKILVMTERELTDEEYTVQKADTDSEEEFFDVSTDPDGHIRDVAQQLFDAVTEPQVAETAPIFVIESEGNEQSDADDVLVAGLRNENERTEQMTDIEQAVFEVTKYIVSQLSQEETETVTIPVEVVVLEDDLPTPVVTSEANGTDEKITQLQEADQEEFLIDATAEVTTPKDVAQKVQESPISERHSVEPATQITEIQEAATTSETTSEAVITLDVPNVAEEAVEVDDQKLVVDSLISLSLGENVLEASNEDGGSEAHQVNKSVDLLETLETAQVVPPNEVRNLVGMTSEKVTVISLPAVPSLTDSLENKRDEFIPSDMKEDVQENTGQTICDENQGKDIHVEIAAESEVVQQTPIASIEEEVQELSSLVFLPEDVESSVETEKEIREAPLIQVQVVKEVQEVSFEALPEDIPSEQGLLVVSTPKNVHVDEELETSDVVNPETIEEETMPTLVISDEVKTPQTTTDDDLFTDCSTHEVKVDFDGYSSGREESLSSSTSSESFEFAETVPSPNNDERTQALRNSIIERYPSNETDDDDLDSVGDECDEDLLAVKQISAEVEQLVAAINAFGRDEEQQMSAYMVGKKMADGKRKKSAMEAAASTLPCQDQLVQTDEDLILVERNLPEVMENLQSKIERLQADLDKVRTDEKELLKINAKLQEELNESQQTIDGIEVEAEQQYTELTSEIDELCDIVLKKDQELAGLKEKVANLSVSELNLKDDVDGQRSIVQRQKEIIEGLREELDAITKKLGDMTKLRDKAMEEATIYKMKNMERERFLSREAQMSMEIEDLQRELNKQKLILNQTSMAKLADTFDRKVLHLENELRERDMLICKQNQIINSHRKSPTGSVITQRKMQPRASVLAAAGNLPSAGSSSESFQNGLDSEAKEALLSFILSDRHNQLANIYNIGRILDLTAQEERAVERHLTKDRFA